MNELYLNNELNNNVEIEKEQNNFMESAFGVAANEALDYGLKTILPDFIEDKVIIIKDVIFEKGIKEGIDKCIETVADIGKSVQGVFTGNFEKISQVEMAVEKGGVIDNLSDCFEKGVNFANEKNFINEDISKNLIKGKNIMEKSLDNSINKVLKEQEALVKDLDKSISKWEENKTEKNFEKMEEEYKKIVGLIEKTFPLSDTIERLNELENIHTLIQNNGFEYTFTETDLLLSKKLK